MLGKSFDLSSEDNSILAQQISSTFDKFNDKRQAQLISIDEIKKHIFSHNTNSFSWNNDVHLPDVYELSQTLKSHLIENLYSNPEAMFDVQGVNEDAQQLANSHKAMLVNAFQKMNFKNEMESIVDSIVEAGEATLFIGWNTLYKKKRRPQNLEEKFLSPSQDGFVIEDKLAYDGPIVKCINPADFVFDVDRFANFDSCPKIYRSFLDISEIAHNKSYNCLNDSILEELYLLISSNIPKSNKFRLLTNNKSSSFPPSKFKVFEGGFSSIYSDSSKFSKAIRGNQLEVLEYYGDIKLPNGDILKNWLVTVVGRSKVVRFEQNPFVINPFVHASIIQDPDNLRGVSPIKVALELSSISSTILNKQLDALSLIINPPYLAPKGCFSGEQLVKPGSIIEYDAALMPQKPMPLDFSSAIVGWDFIKFFKNQMESATGVYRNMAGDLRSNENKTATEFNYSVSSQAIRLNMLIDSVSRKIIIPMVQKVAEIISNFKFGKETITYNDNGEVKFLTISDPERSSYDFLYHYGDRKSSLDRKSKFSQLFNIISSFSNMPQFASQIDWVECFKFALEQFGVENSSAFIKQNHSTQNNSHPIDKAS